MMDAATSRPDHYNLSHIILLFSLLFSLLPVWSRQVWQPWKSCNQSKGLINGRAPGPWISSSREPLTVQKYLFLNSMRWRNKLQMPPSLTSLCRYSYMKRTLHRPPTSDFDSTLFVLGYDRGWDGWMASLTQWTWVWVNPGSWWWTGRPGMLRFMGSDTTERLIWSDLMLFCVFYFDHVYSCLVD